MQSDAAVDWPAIDTVLLDMDGTLLDLRFDNRFWLQCVPEHYGSARGMSPEEARNQLAPKFREVTGTMSWYCVDYWSRELNLDIRALTRANLREVRYLPGAVRFLQWLQDSGKRIVLVTNAHPDLLDMKDQQVAVKRFFHACYSTHRFDAPKEDASFWPRLRQTESFDPARTLFVDDNLPVLKCAQLFGIAHLRAIRCPDSDHPPKATENFVAVDRIDDLLAVI